MARGEKQFAGDISEDSEPMADAARRLLDVEDDRAGSAPDILRRLMGAGLSGLFTTEAAIRGALGDTVPREWVDFLAGQSERTRDEFIGRLVREFSRVLENVDLVELADELLTGRTVEIRAEFRLKPRDEDDTNKSRGSPETGAPRHRNETEARITGLEVRDDDDLEDELKENLKANINEGKEEHG